MTTYAKKLQNPKWQRKRLEILERDNWACTMCGDTETTLNVHHQKYNGEPWEADSSDLKTLCVHCHYCIERVKVIHSDSIVLEIQKKPASVSGIYYLTVVCKYDDDKHGICLFSYDVKNEDNSLLFLLSIGKEAIYNLYETINSYS